MWKALLHSILEETYDGRRNPPNFAAVGLGKIIRINTFNGLLQARIDGVLQCAAARLPRR
jgi:hypothetical protein